MRRSRSPFYFLVAITAAIVTGADAPAADSPLVIPEGVTFETDIEYATPAGERLALDLARPKSSATPLPAIVCIHGGGFRAGNRQHHDRLCIQLAERGYVAVTVSYRLAPKHQFPAAVRDVKGAVRWLRANAIKYGVDPDRIGATGDSAGGHLALFLGVTGDVKEFDDAECGHPEQSSRVQCVVDVYGPSDLTKSYGKSVDAAEVLPLFLGGNLETARHQHILASPLYWVTPRSAPTLAIHGTQDPMSPMSKPNGSSRSCAGPTLRRSYSPWRGPATDLKGTTRPGPDRRCSISSTNTSNGPSRPSRLMT